ncbi:uncharacterized protein [Lepisosteus oculatus]|uniref:uncharacterized protein isoform X2 n=1 Tax=Lepisosteus oculatus TaxID=7918 RepID=UPI0035F5001C
MKLPCFASHSVIAVLLSVCRVSALTVRGSVGQEVTLPCRYSVRDLGVTTMCWGRGELPLSGCNNMIISTDGQSVNSRLSERYQLLGQLTGGDVSLTILHAQESDSGLYGCRVEIPGWFNDQKHTVNLIVTKVTGVSALTVRGSVGQDVTLPCRYSVTDHGVTMMCWGRGEPTLSWCNNMIISTDGQSVNSRLSERYQLLGQLTGGDVSLTILHAQESDSGLYGCRVEIPGWFNDQKHTVNLIITKAPYTTAATEATVSASTEQPWDRSTGHTTGRQHNYTQGGAVRTGTHPPHVPKPELRITKQERKSDDKLSLQPTTEGEVRTESQDSFRRRGSSVRAALHNETLQDPPIMLPGPEPHGSHWSLCSDGQRIRRPERHSSLQILCDGSRGDDDVLGERRTTSFWV